MQEDNFLMAEDIWAVLVGEHYALEVDNSSLNLVEDTALDKEAGKTGEADSGIALQEDLERKNDKNSLNSIFSYYDRW